MTPSAIQALATKHAQAFFVELAALVAGSAGAASAPAETPKESGRKTKKDPTTETPKVELPTLRALGMQLVQASRQDELQDICKKFGSANLTKLPVEHYEEAFQLLTEAVNGSGDLL